MTAQMTNQSLDPMDDLLLTLSETSARAALTVEILQQRSKQQQFRTTKGDDRVGSRLPSRNVDPMTTMRPISRTVQSSITNQLVNSGNTAILEHTTTVLREQAKLIAWLSEELVEERQRRGMAENATADLRGQLAELERNLSADMSDLVPGYDGIAGAVQETPELAQMEDQARDWRKRSRRKPRSARRWLRRSMRRLLIL